jgi:hypothetical protein
MSENIPAKIRILRPLASLRIRSDCGNDGLLKESPGAESIAPIEDCNQFAGEPRDGPRTLLL